MDTLVGQTIKGYEIEEVIGEGGFGVVYRAQQPLMGRTVAIKSVWPALSDDAEFIRRFEVEAQTIASLEHPQIVPIYDYWRDPTGAYLVMRWLRGGSLRQAMQQKSQWRVEEAVQLLGQIANALQLAHRYGIVHRDVKPENILLDEDGNGYLTDFGIARVIEYRHLDGGFAEGSPAYAAPEQLVNKAVSPQTDQYSLAVVIFELLTGQHPFPDILKLSFDELMVQRAKISLPPITTLRPDLPAELNEVLIRATALQPFERFPDTLAFAKAFRQALRFRASQRAEASLFQDDTLSRTPGGTIRTPEGTAVVDKILSPAAEHEHIPNPYKGLRAFQEADAGTFFGREKLTEHLVQRLAEQGEEARFLAVVGPSGSGKSSLVKAGLLPALRQNRLPGSEQWFIVEMVPGSNPLEELEIALLRIASKANQNLNEHLKRDERGLLRALRLILPEDESQLLLVIDQFEEVFTLSDDEHRISHFLNNLVTALTEPNSRLRLIVTLRADFYDRPLLYPGLSSLIRQRTEVVIPMSPEELERAIVGPAKQVGVNFESSLVTAIVSEVSGHLGALPLLQYGLMELFERRNGLLLTLDAYRAIGGTLGAVARRAESIYTQLNRSQQDISRQIFLRLITLGENTDDTRRRVLLSELLSITPDHQSVRTVLDEYGRSRLLTFDRDPTTRGPTVEVAHEAILREWTRLRGWLETSRNDLRLERTLAALAEDWHSANRDVSFLLRGGRLEQFERWYQSTSLALTENEKSFIDASLQERQVQQVEEERRKVEQNRLEQQARLRLYQLVAALIVFSLGALVLTVYAFQQNSQAQSARATSEANAALSQSLALAANAQSALQSYDSDLALALAFEAVRIPQAPLEARRLLANIALAPGTQHIFEGHTSAVRTLDISPDSTWAVSGSVNGEIIIWDLPTGSIRYRLEGNHPFVKEVVINPLGEQFISVGEDQQIFVWDPVNGVRLQILQGHTGSIEAAVFSIDGQTLITGGKDNTVRLWDVNSSQLLNTFEVDQEVHVLEVTRNGEQIIAGLRNGDIILIDFENGEILRRFEGHTNIVHTLDFSPTENSFVSGSEDGRVMLWNVRDDQPVRLFQGHTGVVYAVAFSHDGRTIFSGSLDTNIIQWDVETGNSMRTFVQRDTGIVLDLSIGANSQSMIAAYGNGTLRLWQLTSVGQTWRFDDPGKGLIRVVISPDGTQALTSSGPSNVQGFTFTDNALVLLNMATGDEVRRMEGHFAPIAAVAFTPDGQYAVSGSIDTRAILWDLNTGELVRDFTGHTGIVYSVAISPDGQTLITSSADHSLIVWDLQTGEVVRRLSGHDDDVISVAISPDGQTALSGSDDDTLILWNIETGEMLRRFTGHTGLVFSVAFHPSEQIALSGSLDTSMIEWDLTTGAIRHVFQGHTGVVSSVAYTPDGRMALSGSDDRTVLLWDMQTYELVRAYEGHTGTVTGVAVAPDGTQMLSASFDGTLRAWELPAPDLIQRIDASYHLERYLRPLTCEERNIYRLLPLCDSASP